MKSKYSKYSKGLFVLSSREPLKRVYREVVCDVCSVVSLRALDRIFSLLIKYHKVCNFCLVYPS
ncbi:hypothetical protein DV515_00002850 [Chloebia gouldiae]|uniref:Uncharacterized protein n=1 Tax=Chloebia gouldiae TaxID=44316 RepID=A0A3L8SV32_CHLGU|nr:hypothetical protein DV515_00002850 [Chloebia gouldiae]